jgi:hypothetical protein
MRLLPPYQAETLVFLSQVVSAAAWTAKGTPGIVSSRVLPTQPSSPQSEAAVIALAITGRA